jgi:penicillin-binding protein 1C
MPPRIITPAQGSVFVLDPDLPDGGGRLLLRAAGGGDVKWTSTTLAVSAIHGLYYATLTPGDHELRAVDPDSGAESHARFQVKAARDPHASR